MDMHSDIESPQREKAVPRMLNDLVAQAGRLSKLSEDLESRLSDGLRPESSVPAGLCNAKSDTAPEVCAYEQQLSDIRDVLTDAEKRLDSILGRLEI